MRVYLNGTNTVTGNRAGMATLVDIIVCGEPLDMARALKYYGDFDGPKVARKLQRYTRLVFKRDSGGYVVVPEIPRNRGYWVVVHEDDNAQESQSCNTLTQPAKNPRV